MILLLPTHHAAVGVVVGGGAFKFLVINEHIRPDGAGVGAAQQRNLDLGSGKQEHGMKPHLGGQGVEGGVGGVGGQNGKLLKLGQMIWILEIELFMVAEDPPGCLVVAVDKVRQPGGGSGIAAAAVLLGVGKGHIQNPIHGQRGDEPGVELTDEIGTLCLRAEEIGFQCIVMGLLPVGNHPVDLLTQLLSVFFRGIQQAVIQNLDLKGDEGHGDSRRIPIRLPAQGGIKLLLPHFEQAVHPAGAAGDGIEIPVIKEIPALQRLAMLSGEGVDLSLGKDIGKAFVQGKKAVLGGKNIPLCRKAQFQKPGKIGGNFCIRHRIDLIFVFYIVAQIGTESRQAGTLVFFTGCVIIISDFGGVTMLELFLTFAKIGLFTIGGGYAMIAIVEDTCVNEKKWMTHEEMMELIVIAESTPGPIAINCATFAGYRRKGLPGAAAATLGIVMPSFVVIYLISMFLGNFLEIPWVAAAFRGMKVGVGVVMIRAGLGMLQKIPKSWLPRLLFCFGFGAMLLANLFAVHLSTVELMLLAGLVSLAVSRGKEAQKA